MFSFRKFECLCSYCEFGVKKIIFFIFEKPHSVLHQWICLDESFPKLQQSSKNIENWRSYDYFWPQTFGRTWANLPPKTTLPTIFYPGRRRNQSAILFPAIHPNGLNFKKKSQAFFSQQFSRKNDERQNLRLLAIFDLQTVFTSAGVLRYGCLQVLRNIITKSAVCSPP